MASTVTTKVGGIYYELDLDSRTFEVKSRQASSQLDKLESQFNKAEKGSQMFAKGLAVVATSALASLGYGVKIAADLETARQGFVTLLGSAEAADAAIAMIKKDAAKTPFELPGLIQANQQLTQVTKDAERSERLLLNVGKALAAAGKGQAELNNIIANLQQIGNTSKITEQDVRQFGSNGINILELLADYYGVTKNEAVEMVKSSKNAFKDLEAAMAMAGEEGGKFSRAFIEQAGAMNQLWSNFKDAIGIAMAEIVTQTGIFDMVKDAFASMIDLIVDNTPNIVKAVKEFVNVVQNNIPIIIGLIVGGLTPAFLSFAAVAGPALVALSPFIAVGMAVGAAFVVLTDAIFGANAGFAGFIGMVQIAWSLIKGFGQSLYFLFTGQFGRVKDVVYETIGGIGFIVQDTNRKIAESTKKATESQVGSVKSATDEMADDYEELTSEQKKQLEEEEYNFRKSMEKRKQTFQENLQDLIYSHLDKVKSLKQQLSEENSDFAESMEERVKKFNESMDEMKSEHEDRIADIQGDIDEESKEYEESREEILNEAKDQISKETKEYQKRADEIQESIDKEIAKGKNASQIKISQLQEQLETEKQEYDEKVEEINNKADKQTENEKKAKDKRVADLKQQLDEENAEYEKQVAKAVKRSQEEDAREQDRHDKQVMELQTTLNEENAILSKHQSDVDAVKNRAREDDISRLKRKFAEENAMAEQDHQRKLADITNQGQQQGQTLGRNINAGLASQKPLLMSTMDDIGRSTAQVMSSSISQGAKEAGRRMVSDFVNGLIDKARSSISYISSVVGGSIAGSLFSPIYSIATRLFPGFAEGVTNFRGGMAVVGEEGPELAYLPRGTNIVPNMNTGADTASMLDAIGMKSGGGVEQNINIYIDKVNDQQDIESIGRELGFRASLMPQA